MALVARWNSRELFFLSTITLAVGVGYVAWRFGLSMAIGAFVAGLVVSESEYAHQALSDVAPLRDLFGMLFFVSVGMLLDPAAAVGAARHARRRGRGDRRRQGADPGRRSCAPSATGTSIPLAVGLTLFQVGEFAFVLARAGLSSGALSADVYNLAMNAAIVTMVLTPLVSSSVPALYERFWPKPSREAFEATNIPETGLRDQVVICGAGRVGRSVADALHPLGLPFVLVESNDRRVQQARRAGLPVIYGDASQPLVLEAAGLARARAILVTVSGVRRRARHRRRGAADPARYSDHRPRRQHRRRARPLRPRHPGSHLAGVRGGHRDDPPGADALQRAGPRRAQHGLGASATSATGSTANRRWR